MKYKGIIFDFDYTLGDSTEGIVTCVNTALRRLGYDLADREEIRKTIGLDLQQTYLVLTKDANQEQAEKFSSYFREKADQIMTENTSFFPGVLELLQKWHRQGMRLAIVTTKYHYRIEAILEKYQASGLFDIIIGGEDVKRPKPDPEGVLQVLGDWQLPKDQALYVGDSLVDARTAQAAGVDFAGVTTGTTSKAELQAYPNVGVAQALDELDSMLLCKI